MEYKHILDQKLIAHKPEKQYNFTVLKLSTTKQAFIERVQL